MTDELMALCVIALVFILLCMMWYSRPQNEPEPEPKNKPNNNNKYDNIIEALNLLLSLGVIDQSQYNQIIVKLSNKL